METYIENRGGKRKGAGSPFGTKKKIITVGVDEKYIEILKNKTETSRSTGKTRRLNISNYINFLIKKDLGI